MNTIEEAQEKLIKEIAETKELAYEDFIVPRCDELKSKIKGFPTEKEWPVYINSDPIVLYYELLFREFIEGTNLSNKLLVLLMTYRPIVYHLLAMKKTESELGEWNEELLKEIDNVFMGDFKHTRVEELKKIIELSTRKIDVSTITFYHYFIGIQFHRPYIGITLQHVREIVRDVTIVAFNVTYKLPKHKKSVYVYHQPPDIIGKCFNTKEIIDQFHPIEKIEAEAPSEMYSLLDDKISDKNAFVLKYSPDCYTLISNGEIPLILDANETQRFIDGALPSIAHISKERLLSHASLIYHESLPLILDANESKNDITLPEVAEVFSKLIKPILSKFSTMNRHNYRRFCKILNASIDEYAKDSFNECDKRLFLFYIEMYSFIEWNYNEFVSYVWAYFETPIDDE